MRPKGPSLFRSDSGLGISGAPRKSIFEATFLGGGHTLFIFKIGHIGAFSPKVLKLVKTRDFRALGARNTGFGASADASVKTPYIIHG